MKADAFEDGGIIPERYAGRGNNVRPGFTFSNIPDGTVSFAIIFHDVDVASLTSAFEHALQPEVAARARSIASDVRGDGAQAAARRLISLQPV
jgi:phosphatidylethanolamine-binding protein (PEBP) family uncharacterized protein